MRIINVSVNPSRATLGEQINITWDYQNADRLSRHQTELVGHNFQTLTAPSTTPLALATRSISFEFTGPLTVVIAAWDESDTVVNVAFDILLDTGAFYFSADLSTANVDYPRLGFANGETSRTIDFSSFLGFYDIHDTGVIDGLVTDELFPGFSTTEAFRALSPLEFESQNFGFVQGIAYPFLDIDFRQTPEGQRFENKSRANAIIFGGATAYNGTPFTIKTDEGEMEGRENLTSAVEAIFMAIDIRTTADGGGGTHYIADVHIGNLAQNLVVSVFHGIVTSALPPSTLGNTESATAPGDASDPDLGIATGQILGGYISEDKTDLNNNIQFIGLSLDKVFWRVPFYPDTRILEVPTITY